MNLIINIKDFLQGVFLKIFPSLGYKSVVNTQILLYKKLKQENYKSLKQQSKAVRPAVGLEAFIDENGNIKKDIDAEVLNEFRNKNDAIVPLNSEEDILNTILDSRRRSFNEDSEADTYYQKIIATPRKTLEQIICAIVEWEYLDNTNSHKIRAEKNLPQDFVDRYRQEIKNYIRYKIGKL